MYIRSERQTRKYWKILIKVSFVMHIQNLPKISFFRMKMFAQLVLKRVKKLIIINALKYVLPDVEISKYLNK